MCVSIETALISALIKKTGSGRTLMLKGKDLPRIAHSHLALASVVSKL